MNMMSFGVSQVDLLLGMLSHVNWPIVMILWCSPSFKPFFHEPKHEQVIFVRTHLLSLLCMRACFLKKRKKKKEKLGTHSTQ